MSFSQTQVFIAEQVYWAINMVMVSSAVLGAAAGTGLALLLAVTIVMYRYYLLRKRGKVSTQKKHAHLPNAYSIYRY